MPTARSSSRPSARATWSSATTATAPNRCWAAASCSAPSKPCCAARASAPDAGTVTPPAARPATSRSSRGLFRYFDQVLIRIAHVNRAYRPVGAGARDRPLLNRHAQRGQMRDHLIERTRGDKTQVERTGCRQRRLRQKLLAVFVQIDFLLAKFKGHTA